MVYNSQSCNETSSLLACNRCKNSEVALQSETILIARKYMVIPLSYFKLVYHGQITSVGRAPACRLGGCRVAPQGRVVQSQVRISQG